MTHHSTRLLLTVALLSLAATAPAPRASRMYRLAELPRPQGWGAYGGGDTWPGVLGNGDYRLPLDPTLPPGKYRIQVRTLNVPRLSVTIADTRHDVKLVRNDFSEPLDVEATAAADALVLHAQVPPGVEANPILQAVYITTDRADVIGPDGVAVRQAVGASVAPPIPPAPELSGNYLENSSFEVGPGHGWGKFYNDQLDDTTVLNGKTSVRLPVTLGHVGGDVGHVFRFQRLESKFYRLPPGRYAVSGYFKADRPTKGRLFFGLAGHPAEPRQSGFGPMLGGPVELTTEWNRVTHYGEVTEVPGNLWCVVFDGEWRVIERGLRYDTPPQEILKRDFTDIPKTVWVDALQVERVEPDGSAADHQTRREIEVGVRCDQPGHILYDDEPPRVRLLVHNPAKRDGNVAVKCRIEDYHDSPVREFMVTVPLNRLTHAEAELSIPLERRGIFRLLVSLEGGDRAVDELVYSVLPRNKHLNDFHDAGRTGSDSGFDPRGLAILKRANVNWIVHKTIGRMEVVQPKLGEFHWMDDELQAALDAKMNVLGQVFVNDPPPYMRELYPTPESWDPQKKRQFLKLWGEYVGAVVGHYKGKIRHWEVTNEPYFYLSPEDHADVLRVASDAIRSIDPDIHVVGFCSANMPQYFPRAVRAAEPSWYDGISGHFYDSSPPLLRGLAEVLQQQKKTGWQTEAGPTFPSFYVTLPTYQQLIGDEHHANPSSKTIRDQFSLGFLHGELRCYGIGRIDHYFHYFTRFGNATPSEPTRRGGSGKEDVEYDGSLRPYAVARSIASHFLDGAKPHAEWRGDGRVTLCLFESPGGGTVGFGWSTAGQPLRLTPPADAGWKVYDWFGNEQKADGAGGGGFQIDQFPHYFICPAAPTEVRKLLDSGILHGRFGLAARVVPAATGWTLRLTAREESGAPQKVSMSFGGVLGGYVGNAESVAELALEANEHRPVDLPLLGPPGERSLVVAVRGADFDATFPFRFRIAEAPRLPKGKDFTEIPADAWLAFNPDLIRRGAGNRMTPGDFTPAIHAAYDDECLYLSARVTDDEVVDDGGIGQDAPGDHDQVHFQIATPGGVAVIDARPAFARSGVSAHLRRPAGDDRPLTVSRKTVRDGYQLTVVVAWATLGTTAPKPGTSFAFNAVAYDADLGDEAAEPKTEWPWAGGQEFDYADRRGWGELVFPAE